MALMEDNREQEFATVLLLIIIAEKALMMIVGYSQTLFGKQGKKRTFDVHAKNTRIRRVYSSIEFMVGCVRDPEYGWNLIVE